MLDVRLGEYAMGNKEFRILGLKGWKNSMGEVALRQAEWDSNEMLERKTPVKSSDEMFK